MNETLEQISVDEFRELKQKVDEVHEFMKRFAQTLEGIGKNPMLKAMLPPGMKL